MNLVNIVSLKKSTFPSPLHLVLDKQLQAPLRVLLVKTQHCRNR